MKFSSIFEPAVVRTPWVQKMSLCAIGMPSSGERASPLLRRASLASAAARAWSKVSVM
jgi:hypothetical protein